MDKKIIGKYFLVTLLVVVVFLGGASFGRFIINNKSDGCKTRYENRLRNKSDQSKENRKFISSLSDCAPEEGVSNILADEMRAKVIKLVEEQKNNGNIDHASVYFRDLNNGPWFGVEEQKEFNPGSLLKVPKMLSVFKQVEKNPLFLDKMILAKGVSSTFVQYYKPAVKMAFDRVYSVKELLELMIIHSDNDAAAVLGEFLGEDILQETFQDIGVNVPTDGNYLISVRNYSSFFRILFNASYLNKKYSEQALRLLSQTMFDKGLRAGLPVYMQIAHKFGERTVGGQKQLHDCGIIYYPEKPYILCVMTVGKNAGFDDLASFIASVSKTVYDSIDKDK